MPMESPPPASYKAHRCSFHRHRPDPYLRLSAVTVFVRDQDRSLQFYLDELGFWLAFDVHFPSGDRWLAVSPPDGTATLALVALKPASEEYKLIGLPWISRNGFCWSSPGAEGTVEWLYPLAMPLNPVTLRMSQSPTTKS
jgi:hypothetical protein